MKSSRARGRPNHALITKEKIADAAMNLVSVSGYDGLTMAALARKLGVVPSALYNHVKGRDELMLIIEDAVMGLIDVSPLEKALSGEISPRSGIAQWAWNYRNAFADHTPLVQVIAVMPISGAETTVGMYELLVQVFVAAGVPEEEVLPRIIALESFIYGSAYDVRAPSDIFSTVPGQAPQLAAVHEAFSGKHSQAEDVSSTLNPYADRPFQLGLGSLLADIPDAPSEVES